ncbi:MAG: fibronectin type III domain-containing protein, partial [Bryobacteraceae bacterium]
IQDHAESVTAASKPIIPVDTFPPAVPSGLTAAAGVSSVELAWERDTESDLKNYIVYRSAAGGPFEKIAEVNTPSYSDLKVQSGKDYSYEVSAIDQLGNESERSKPVEAKAP